MSNTYVIGLGSSHPKGLDYLHRATEMLEKTQRIYLESSSKTMMSGGVGTKDALIFRNSAILINSVLSPSSLWLNLRLIETRLGRIRTSRNSPRTIDLDMLWWSNGHYSDQFVTLPHPRFYERQFALELARQAFAKASQNKKHHLSLKAGTIYR